MTMFLYKIISNNNQPVTPRPLSVGVLLNTYGFTLQELKSISFVFVNEGKTISKGRLEIKPSAKQIFINLPYPNKNKLGDSLLRKTTNLLFGSYCVSTSLLEIKEEISGAVIKKIDDVIQVWLSRGKNIISKEILKDLESDLHDLIIQTQKSHWYLSLGVVYCIHENNTELKQLLSDWFSSRSTTTQYDDERIFTIKKNGRDYIRLIVEYLTQSHQTQLRNMFRVYLEKLIERITLDHKTEKLYRQYHQLLNEIFDSIDKHQLAASG